MAIDFDKCELLQSGNVRTPKVRLTYPFIITPGSKARKDKDGNEYRPYTCGFLFPPTADLTLLKIAGRDAAIEKFGAEKIKEYQDRGKWNTPFLDAFAKSKTDRNPAGDEQFRGWTLIRTSSKSRPGIVDRHGNNVSDESEVYGGRWCFASLAAHAYPSIDGGNPGVGFYLQNVQLLDHDEPLGGGRVSADREFVPVETPGDTGPASGAGQSSDSVFGGSESAVNV